jgi:lauroyl/myristoyl acyltransferase
MKKITNFLLLNFLLLLARILVLFPFKWQLAFGRSVGRIALRRKRTQHIVMRNLTRSFPEKSSEECAQLCKDSLESLGMGLIESINAWYMSNRRFRKIKFIFHNDARLEECADGKQAEFFLSGHFHTMELVARNFLPRYGINTVYNRCSEPVFERSVSKQRNKHYSCIERTKLRAAIKVLKNKGRIVFAPDQNRGNSKASSKVPFFGIHCDTTNSIGKIPKSTNARVFFLSLSRDFEKGEYHYHLQRVQGEITPSLFNDLLEKAVREHPEQYLWTHRRFDHRLLSDPESFYAYESSH